MMIKFFGLWHWPGWRQLIYGLALGLIVLAWFTLVFGGAEWVVGQHSYRVRLQTPLDLAMPFWPWMSVVYLSHNLLMWSAPFVLRSSRELRAMAATLSGAVLIAGIGFLLLPGEIAFNFPADDQSSLSLTIWRFAHWVALPHNFLPSLHVAFVVICATVYASYATPLGKTLLVAWGVAIVLSTLVTYQHYLADVVAGAILGACCVRWTYRPMTTPQQAIPASERCPASPALAKESSA
jgi:membrane-associated phospholipid phosphatase